MRLETLTLSTRDLPRARSFYSAKLGFPVVEDRDGEWFVVDAGGIKLHVEQGGTLLSPLVGRSPTSLPRAAVQKAPLQNAEPRLVFHTRDLRAICLELRDRGVSVEGPLSSPGGAQGIYAELADPDGHPIVLMERASN